MPDAAVIDELDALAADEFDFVIQHILGQAILGNAVAEHAARGGHGFVDRDGKPRLARSSAAVSPAGPPPMIGDLLGVRRGVFSSGRASWPAASISISLSEANRFSSRMAIGVIRLAARAFGLAGMGADAAADRRKRIALADQVRPP